MKIKTKKIFKEYFCVLRFIIGFPLLIWYVFSPFFLPGLLYNWFEIDLNQKEPLLLYFIFIFFIYLPSLAFLFRNGGSGHIV